MIFRTRSLLILALILSLTVLLCGQATQPAPVPAPAWIMVTAESSAVAVVLPAGTTYRFGDTLNNRWSAPVTLTEATTFSPVFFPANVFPFSDPDVGVPKELDVLQTATPQTITVTDTSVSPATTVAQVVPGFAIPTSVPMTPGTAYTVTLSDFAIVPGVPATTPMVALVNMPPTLANQGWQGTHFSLTIDGVTLICTSGPGSGGQAVSLSCTVPAPPSGS
jgi:hypothetical protein